MMSHMKKVNMVKLIMVAFTTSIRSNSKVPNVNGDTSDDDLYAVVEAYKILHLKWT